MMRKRDFGILLLFVLFAQVNAQSTIRARYTSDDPVIDGDEDHIYSEAEAGYINFPGNPNYGDLGYPDLELQFKPVWNENNLYLIFRHLDDILVSGYLDEDLSITDTLISEGLENRDATVIYLYLGDSTRLENTIEPDSLTFWLRWTWKSNDVEARLTDGSIINSFEEFFAVCEQKYQDPFWYSEISIDLDELVKSAGLEGLYTADSVTKIGFDLELDENDKEIDNAPFSIQTRAFWGSNLWENAQDKPSDWGIMKLERDTLVVTGLGRRDMLTDVSLFPNPASDFVYIVSELTGLRNIRILDRTGRVLYTKEVYDKHTKIPVEQLDKGYYIIQVFGYDDRFYSQPLIKK